MVQRIHEIRSRPLESTPWAYWIRGCTRYSTSSDDILILKDEKTKPARLCHVLTPEQAIKLVLESIKSIDTADHGDYVRRSLSPEELPFLLFNEIDETLFAGVLKGNVHLQFEDRLPPGLQGMTTRAGLDLCPRITISMLSQLRYTSPQTILETLLHQMIHAYLLQCCGHRNRGVSGTAHDLQHGKTFCTLSTAIHTILFRRPDPLPSRIGVASSRYEVHREIEGRAYGHPRSRRHVSYAPAVEAGRSHCDFEEHWGDYRMAFPNIQHISTSTAVPKLDLEAKCPVDKEGTSRPLTQYVHTVSAKGKYSPILRTAYTAIAPPAIEIVYKDRAIPIPLSLLASHVPSLANKKASTPLPFLADDDSSFTLLYDFLTTGKYAPPLFPAYYGPHQQQDPPHRRGPPCIVSSADPYRAASLSGDYYSNNHIRPLMLSDVKAARLGDAMEIPELRALAMERLWNHEICAEDPVAVLEYAYNGPPEAIGKEGKKGKKDKNKDKSKDLDKENEDDGEEGKKAKPKDSKEGKCKLATLKPLVLPPEPDPGLRGWVRKWLTGRPAAGGKSNLDILRSGTEWSEGWRKLRERGGCLVSDMDAVEEAIKLDAERGKQEEERISRERDMLLGAAGNWARLVSGAALPAQQQPPPQQQQQQPLQIPLPLLPATQPAVGVASGHGIGRVQEAGWEAWKRATWQHAMQIIGLEPSPRGFVVDPEWRVLG